VMSGAQCMLARCPPAARAPPYQPVDHATWWCLIRSRLRIGFPC
jgi:hypothetical protein